jgi:hypothetical protein
MSERMSYRRRCTKRGKIEALRRWLTGVGGGAVLRGQDAEREPFITAFS